MFGSASTPSSSPSSRLATSGTAEESHGTSCPPTCRSHSAQVGALMAPSRSTSSVAASTARFAAPKPECVRQSRTATVSSSLRPTPWIRNRVNELVEDGDTAEKLKAWYQQLCKRPCFHDEYLQSFNEPNVHLVDTDAKGVERITERGVVVAGVEYEVGCIIYASGFEVGTPHERRAGFDLVGRDGVKLSERWAEGMRTMHGMHVHGFPNACQVQAAQAAALISNYPHNLTEAGRTIGCIVRHAVEQGHDVVEGTQEAEDAWIDVLMSGIPKMAGVLGSAECTPGYYNNEGQPADSALARLWAGYPGGPVAFFELLDRWRTDGRFEGLTFS
jgi:hypothetical protein